MVQKAILKPSDFPKSPKTAQGQLCKSPSKWQYWSIFEMFCQPPWWSHLGVSVSGYFSWKRNIRNVNDAVSNNSFVCAVRKADTTYPGIHVQYVLWKSFGQLLTWASVSKLSICPNGRGRPFPTGSKICKENRFRYWKRNSCDIHN